MLTPSRTSFSGNGLLTTTAKILITGLSLISQQDCDFMPAVLRSAALRICCLSPAAAKSWRVLLLASFCGRVRLADPVLCIISWGGCISWRVCGCLPAVCGWTPWGQCLSGDYSCFFWRRKAIWVGRAYLVGRFPRVPWECWPECVGDASSNWTPCVIWWRIIRPKILGKVNSLIRPALRGDPWGGGRPSGSPTAGGGGERCGKATWCWS